MLKLSLGNVVLAVELTDQALLDQLAQLFTVVCVHGDTSICFYQIMYSFPPAVSTESRIILSGGCRDIRAAPCRQHV